MCRDDWVENRLEHKPQLRRNVGSEQLDGKPLCAENASFSKYCIPYVVAFMLHHQ